jgi:DNA-binding transcriptional regulator YiaG
MYKTATISRKIAGRTVAVTVPTEQDPETGEATITLENARRAEVAVAAALAAEGPVVGETFAWMRRALGLQTKHLAVLFDMRPETISRWENSVSPVDRAAWFALSALVLERAGKEPATLERMERIAAGKKPPKQVSITLVA